MSAVRDAYRDIYLASSKSPFPSPYAPWCLIVYSVGYRDVVVVCRKSDGYTFPYLNHFDYHKGHKSWSRCYVGKQRSRWKRELLSEMVQYRDTLNLIYQVTMKKAKITEEDVKAITDPNLRMQLVEAVCLSVV